MAIHPDTPHSDRETTSPGAQDVVYFVQDSARVTSMRQAFSGPIWDWRRFAEYYSYRSNY